MAKDIVSRNAFLEVWINKGKGFPAGWGESWAVIPQVQLQMWSALQSALHSKEAEGTRGKDLKDPGLSFKEVPEPL